MSTKQDFKEAFIDTFIGTCFSVPINYVLAFIAVKYHWSPMEITVYFTTVFFIIAIYRKMKIRRYFRVKYE